MPKMGISGEQLKLSHADFEVVSNMKKFSTALGNFYGDCYIHNGYAITKALEANH